MEITNLSTILAKKKRKETEREVAIEECRVKKLVSKQTPNGILSNKVRVFVSASSFKMFFIRFYFIFLQTCLSLHSMPLLDIYGHLQSFHLVTFILLGESPSSGFDGLTPLPCSKAKTWVIRAFHPPRYVIGSGISPDLNQTMKLALGFLLELSGENHSLSAVVAKVIGYKPEAAGSYFYHHLGRTCMRTKIA